MASVVRMPAALAQVTEGAVQTWLVEPGQPVRVGDLLAEIETEKAVVEYASEVEGTVARLLVPEGRGVEVGTPILVVAADGDDEAAVERALAEAGASAATVNEAPETSPAAAAPEGEAPSSDAAHERVFASPLARRLARERGLDLRDVVGTGPGGRVTRRDLERAPDAERPAPSPASPARAAEAAAAFVDEPLTGMRRAIARRLTESKTTVPHFYVTAHVRVDALLDLRRQANEGGDVRLSVNDFVLKAVAAALVRVPAANAIWHGDSIRRFTGVDLGVAIAVPGGLVTPVLRGVERLTVGGIHRAVADLAERARAGRIRLEELEGGAFSVSNLGMHGVDEFSAILNPPQSGILAVSAAKPRPVVGEDGALAVATVMTTTLSADHRVVDGALAAEWMAAFVELVEHPVRLLV